MDLVKCSKVEPICFASDKVYSGDSGEVLKRRLTSVFTSFSIMVICHK